MEDFLTIIESHILASFFFALFILVCLFQIRGLIILIKNRNNVIIKREDINLAFKRRR